jgi:hypothetical protein
MAASRGHSVTPPTAPAAREELEAAAARGSDRRLGDRTGGERSVLEDFDALVAELRRAAATEGRERE